MASSSPSPLPSDTQAIRFPPQNPGLVEQYLSAILSLEPSPSYAGLLGLLVQFCTSQKELDVVNQHKVGGLAGGEEKRGPWGDPGVTCSLLGFSLVTTASCHDT